MLTAKRFWLISLLILTFIMLEWCHPVVEWEDRKHKRIKFVSIDAILDEHPKEITRKIQFTTNGTYVVSYSWQHQNKETKRKGNTGVPESLAGVLEIYDLNGNLLQKQLLQKPYDANDPPNARRANGMWTMMIHTKSLKTRKPVIFKISNLKIGADDTYPPSKINFTIFKANFIFGF